MLEMIGDKRTKEYSGHARPVRNGNGLANLAGNFCQRTFYAAGAAHLQVILCRSSCAVILALFVQVPDRSYFLRHRDVAQFR